MGSVLFIFNEEDANEVKSMAIDKLRDEDPTLSSSILRYDEIKKQPSEFRKAQAELKLLVFFIGEKPLSSSIIEDLKDLFLETPYVVVILKGGRELVPIFLQKSEYIYFRDEPRAIEQLKEELIRYTRNRGYAR
jgi:hypothetical protein